MQPTPPSTQHTHDPIRKAYNCERHQRKLWQEILAKREQFDTHAGYAYTAYRKRQEVDNAHKEERLNNPDFAYANGEACIRYIAQMVGIACAYLLSLWLIHRPAEFIAERNFGEDTWASLFVILFFPVALLVMQIIVAEQRGRHRHSWLWRVISLVLVALTPKLLLASFLAKQIALQQIPHFHDFLLLLVLMGLAFVTDAVVIYGTNGLYEPLAFIAFRLQQVRRSCMAEWFTRRYQQHGKNAEHHLRLYYEAVKTHNQAFPERLHEPLPFNEVSKRFLEHWLGYDPLCNQLRES